MHRTYFIRFWIIAALFFSGQAFGQIATNKAVLENMAHNQSELQFSNYALALKMAKKYKWPLEIKRDNKGTSVLIGVDQWMHPVYNHTNNNTLSASTIGTNNLWQGGKTGLNLNGSSNGLANKLALWDGGTPLNTHVEMNGRVYQKDVSIHSDDDHATHVAGTLSALGIHPFAKGMANGISSLIAYDFINDLSEVSGEAANLLVSNHSYGTDAGWLRNNFNQWTFYGNPDSLEDFKFGYYDVQAQMWDSVLYNAPYYQIVQAAGNSRTSNGPAVGSTYYYYPTGSSSAVSAVRKAGISNNDSYGTIPTYGNAKNIITVGAVKGLVDGYKKAGDVEMCDFSSWGPTDDGRIKPDIVADGFDVLSSVSTNDNAYGINSGTSMASPAVAGSLFLLQEYYNRLHSGSYMHAATLKGIAIHTADEAGAFPGPDYQFGWGLLNTVKAAAVVGSNNQGNHIIFENVLHSGDTTKYTLIASGKTPVVGTISWTDEPGSVITSYIFNNPTLKLVNDLDIRVIKGNKEYMPWVLDPAHPSYPAIKGDNFRDNVERINIDSVMPNDTFIVQITHKGILARGQQSYSLILSGLNGSSYCASSPLSNMGTRIDSFSFAGITLKNPNNCTSYSDFTNHIGQITSGSSLPLSVFVNSCSSTNSDKVIKVFIDYNNNGSFNDSGELVVTSSVMSGTGNFTTIITTPQQLLVGSKTRLRVVAVETNDSSNVHSCGSYNYGETQDYTLEVVAPSVDISIESVVSPLSPICSNGLQLIAIRLENKGSGTVQSIPITAEIKIGNNTLRTITDNCSLQISPGQIVQYTLPTGFTALANTTYNLLVRAGLIGDQDTSNNSFIYSFTTLPNPNPSTGIAEICNGMGILEVNNSNSSSHYLWYDSPTSTQPIASGANSHTSVVPSNKTYYLSTGLNTFLGIPSKNNFPNGGGYVSVPIDSMYMMYQSDIPVVLRSARFFTGYAGKVTLTVGDLGVQNGNGSYQYTPLSSVALDVPATLPNPVKGTYYLNNPADTGIVLSINLPLPKGRHAIMIRTDSATIFRNDNVSGNVYQAKTPIYLFGNSSSYNPQSNYFGLYHIQVVSQDCQSASNPVVAITATTPTISRIVDTLYSSSPTGNQWYFNGNPVFLANGNQYTPSDSGIFYVTVTDTFGCASQSANYYFSNTVLILDTSHMHPSEDTLFPISIIPNPISNGHFTIKFTSVHNQKVEVSLVNMIGQTCFQKNYMVGNGAVFNERINTANLSSGIYLLTVKQGNTILRRQMMIWR